MLVITRARRNTHKNLSFRSTKKTLVFALLLLPMLGLSKWAHSAGPIEAPLQPLFTVLANAKVSASIEVSGSCEAVLPQLPSMQAPAGAEGSPLEVARAIFAGNPTMKVTADPDGTIRIRQSGIEDDVLNVKIHRVKLGGSSPEVGYYSPNLTLFPILGAPEVSAFMKAHDVEWRQPPLLISTIGVIPPWFPHLSGSLENLTVSQVFDHVLKTFPGIWVYENCPAQDGKRRGVYFNFVLNPKNKLRTHHETQTTQ